MSTPVGVALVGAGLDERLKQLGTFDVERCMNCGVCTATCPLGIEALPRRIMRDALLGREERIEDAKEAIFSCLLCGACQASCPAGVQITEDIRLLRRYLLERER